ncbi:hypothetical protein ACFQU7_05785 [Pseudoroseomonas wenyumeiae]
MCRRGHVARDEIGRIRILGRETRFEVAGHAAARFAAAARKPDPAEPHIRVEPLPPAPPRSPAAVPKAATAGRNTGRQTPPC